MFPKIRTFSGARFALAFASLLFFVTPSLRATEEFRAAFADIFHNGLTSAADVDTMISRLVAGNYNAVVAQVLGYMDNSVASHGAHWKSSIVPWSSRVTASFDPLAYLCQQAHANGIEVHAWLGGSGGAMYRVSTSWPPAGNATLASHPEWFIVPLANSEGNAIMPVDSMYIMDLGSSDAQEYVVSIVRELVTNYEIDGINWDDEINGNGYNAGFGYPAYSQANYPRSGLARYRINTGVTGTPSNTDTAWANYRRRYKNELMARCQAEIQSIKTNPRQPLRHTSAALAYSPVPTSCTFSGSTPYTYFCDWAGMLQNGWIDAAIPQIYSQSTVSNWMDRASSCWKYNRAIFPGLGAYLTTDTVVGNNIKYARTKGLWGFTTYSYAVPNSSTSTSWWSYSATTICTDVVATPSMPWRNPATATEGIIWGRVLNVATSSYVDDATVTVSGRPAVKTDGNGYYVATLVPAASGGTAYSATATKSGLPSQTINYALVLPGDVVRYDFSLGTAPTAPSGLTANAVSSSQIDLSWTDNSSNETGFIVARSTVSGGPYSDIATIPETTYSDTGLANNTTYYYVVRATASGVDSANTAQASATTFAVGPSITAQPQSQTVATGQNATFTVSATGTAPLGYQWRFNGGNIGGATTSSYTKSSVLLGDSGSYSVVVANVAGSVTSADAILTVTAAAVPPTIIGQPQSQTVVAGQNATFNVTATGTAPFTYQWKFGGVDIVGATSSAFTRSNAQSSDAGSYSVGVTNSAGGTLSSSAVLTINYSLTTNVISGGGIITLNPDRSSYASNSAVTLTATANTGFVFNNWSGDASGSSNPLSVTMTNNKSITANFSSSLTDIILDNTNANVTFVGSWKAGTTSSDKYGSDYRFADTLAGGTSNVTYRPNISVSGYYDVSIWYPQGANRATNAPWSVVYNGGTTNVAVNQTANGGGWRVIVSSKPFIEGNTGYVRLSNDSIQNGKVVLADAVRFVYVAPLPASIVSQPQNLIISQGENAVFDVGAIGTGPLNYRWFKNGSSLADGGNISGAASASLTMASASTGNAGTYTVIVTNATGAATSNPATLEVVIPPGITSQPSSRTNNAGTTATFTVISGGTDPLAYQWMKNGLDLADGGNVAGAHSSSLTLTAVSQSDAASYTVEIDNAGGSATSNPATLTVIDPPVITGQPASRTDNAGAIATFTINLGGTSPFTICWKKNGVNLSETTHFIGTTTTSLVVSNVSQSDAATYTVAVTNAAGDAASSPVTLTVIDPPAITGQPANSTKVAGATATFTASLSGSSPMSFQWKKNNANLSNGGNVNGATSASLTLAAVSQADNASYTIAVTNAAGGVVSSPATLTVLDPPAITSQPFSRTNDPSTPATFSVVATGSAPLSYQWFKGGSPLSNSGNISRVTSPTLSLSSVTASDAGTYSVVITNAAGTATSAGVGLIVNSPPSITTQPQSQTVSAGQNSSFNVVATGTAPLSYQWRKDQVAISGQTTSALSLANVQISDVATYSVVISNSAGSVTSSGATLTISTALSVTAQPQSRTNIVATKATFSVSATGQGSLSYQWQRGTNSLFNNLYNGINIVGVTSAQLTINSVAASDAADYRVIVKDSFGQITSDPATLTVLTKPAISVQPSNRTSLVGTLANFSVTASGGSLNYFWRKGTSILSDTTKIAGTRAATLTVSELALDDAGSYSVIVSNVVGSVTSAAAVLKPVEPVLIRIQPSSRTSTAATTATFKVFATGTGTLSYQWKKGTDNLVNGGNIYGTTTPTLTITGVTSASAGDYSVRVTDALSTTNSDDATLTVLYKPAIVTQPSSQTHIAGANAIFNVAATGGNLNYQWKRGTTNLTDGAKISGAATDALTLLNLSAADAGANYSVVVANGAGTTTSALAGLTVISPPEIVKQPTNQPVVFSSNAVFRVVATGSAPMSYQWRKGSSPLANLAGKISGATTTNLTVLAANYSDVGSYSVVISNVLDTATSSSVLLRIVPGIKIVSPASGASFNTAAILVSGTASGTSGPALTQVLWQLDGGPFSNTTGAGTTNWSTTVNLHAGTNVFGVKVVDAAGNESDVVTRPFFLNVYSKITLVTNGTGSITGVANQQNLLVGRNYSVTATAAAGQMFSNWTGTATSSNNPFVFKMESGMVIAANFIPNPFLTRTGIYNGLYFEDAGISHARSGFFTMNLNSAGSYSGSFYLAGTNRTMSGKLAVTGGGRFAYTGVPPVTLDFALDMASDSGEIHGTITGNGWQAPLLGDRAEFIYAPRSFSNRLTMAFMNSSDGTSSPGGEGYANVTVKTNGLIALTGKLSDDTTLTIPTTYMSKNGDWPFYATLYGGKGSVIGWLTNAGSMQFQGDVSWIKTAAFGSNYLSGFTNVVTAESSSFPILTSSTPLFSSTNVWVSLSAGTLPFIINNSVTLSNNMVKINSGQTNGLMLTLTLSSGQFSGSFLHPVTLQRHTLRGILRYDQNEARGYFLTPKTGNFLLAP